MKNTQKITDAIISQGILPLYFNSDPEVCLNLMQALYDAGIRAIEFTNRGDAAFENFRKMVALRNEKMPELLLGIGTIKNLDDAKKYLDAGANFLVSPGFVADVAAHCVASDIFYAPGCMTPSEIIATENAGIKFIKLFPGDMLGPAYLSTIKPVFPKLLFMPTGGVEPTAENIGAWFKAGVSAVGMGSKLVSKTLMAEKAYATIAKNAAAVLDTIQQVRNNP